MKLALAVAAVAFILAAVAPNPVPLVVLGLFAMFCALWASERCYRGQSRGLRRIKRRRDLTRLVGNIRRR